MGCSASVASDEEKQEICKFIGKDMMNLCVDEALTRSGEISIKTPPQLQSIKDSSAKLKELGEVKEKEAKEAGEEEGDGGGFIGGMLNKALDVMTGAVEFAADMTASAMSKAFTKSAGVLDQGIEQVEKPMSTIGKDLVSGKNAELSAMLKEFIQKSSVPRAEALCMGDDTDALSKCLITDASTDLADKLKAVVGEKLKEHKAITAWKKCIDTYNKMCEQVAKMKLGEDFAPKTITLDLEAYVCKSCAEEIGRLMGESEKKIRAAPGNKGVKLPDLFEKVFKKPRTEKDELLASDYNTIKKQKE